VGVGGQVHMNLAFPCREAECQRVVVDGGRPSALVSRGGEGWWVTGGSPLVSRGVSSDVDGGVWVPVGVDNPLRSVEEPEGADGCQWPSTTLRAYSESRRTWIPGMSTTLRAHLESGRCQQVVKTLSANEGMV